MVLIRKKTTLKNWVNLVLLCSFSLTLASCAQKPWGTSLEEQEFEAGLALAEEVTTRTVECQTGFESDIIFNYANPLGKRSFTGFLQYSAGPGYKFVATSPLGQPIVIIAGNQKKYQMINTLESMYISGGMTSFALRYKLPIHFLKGRWDDWFTGGNSIPTEYVTDISSDKEQRGIWVTIADNKGAGNISHLLIDTNQKIILERIIETRQNKNLATILYDNFLYSQQCHQPQSIQISGLEYGTTIDITLRETELNSDVKKFKLKPPRGYLKQYRP